MDEKRIVLRPYLLPNDFVFKVTYEPTDFIGEYGRIPTDAEMKEIINAK